ncbi:hypothetical protein [Kitasatospora sp. NPDC093806]|uniref:hypothetical protein n=1 Tax=Kitasatospora sp. NPDC093806 TaxID=3155075 RepID=UPI0034303D35
MTNPMPEAVTGDLIRWALAALSGAADAESRTWADELTALGLPPDGAAEVDVSGLSPALQTFLITLGESSLALDLDPDGIEPAIGAEQYAWEVGDDVEEWDGPEEWSAVGDRTPSADALYLVDLPGIGEIPAWSCAAAVVVLIRALGELGDRQAARALDLLLASGGGGTIRRAVRDEGQYSHPFVLHGVQRQAVIKERATQRERCRAVPGQRNASYYMVLLLDVEGFGRERERFEQEVLRRTVEAVLAAAARSVGWGDGPARDRGDGMLVVLPDRADPESVRGWFRLLMAELPRHLSPTRPAMWLGLRGPGEPEAVLVAIGRRGLRSAATDVRVARWGGQRPLAVLPEPVFAELMDPDHRVLGIGSEGWVPVNTGLGRGRNWAAPWPETPDAQHGRRPGREWRWLRPVPVPSGAPPERLLDELLDTVRVLAGEVTRTRVFAGGGGGGPQALPLGRAGSPQALLHAGKAVATELALLAELIELPPGGPDLREESGQAAAAVRELAEFAESGRPVYAESAEQRLFWLVVRLGSVLGSAAPEGPELPEPVAPEPSVRQHRTRWGLSANVAAARMGEDYS